MEKCEQSLNFEKARTESSLPALIAKAGLAKICRRYRLASDYFKAAGAQSPNHYYGGSRSSLYEETIIGAPTSIRGMYKARKAFKNHYGNYPITSDEKGALLRILGYTLRSVPVVSGYLLQRVIADNAPMVEADFTFPTGYVSLSDSWSQEA